MALNHEQPAAAAARLAAQLGNGDIAWDGTLLGLVPTVRGTAALALLDIGSAASPALLALLSDAERFAAAHVLLTLLHGGDAGRDAANGLAVELRADGTANTDPAQRFELAQRWAARLAPTAR
jgi:hypothetical protein